MPSRNRNALLDKGYFPVNTSDFDFRLPEELIAQEPLPEREKSRLLVYERCTGLIRHLHFEDIVDFFTYKDLMLFNDTRVFPARLYGRKESGGQVEVLLVREKGDDLWEALIKVSRPPAVGRNLLLDGGIEATVVEKKDGKIVIQLRAEDNVREAIEKHGVTPLPPYIRREAVKSDKERYQTIFAKRNGAVAAPTAGLHFSEKIMQKLKNRGIRTETITLHVGPGTFQPVKVEKIEDHKMHEEYFEIREEVAAEINSVKKKGGRIVAVGSTVVRAIESSSCGGKVLPKADRTDIFINPGYNFKIVDAMVTNFHLPRSTLLMLVSAFTGVSELKDIYREAVVEKYRFFSYGDAMLIL